MTQKELRELPENLKPWQVKAVLGCGKDELRVLRQMHPELVVRKCGKGVQGAYIYSKKEVFKIGKISVEESVVSGQSSVVSGQLSGPSPSLQKLQRRQT